MKLKLSYSKRWQEGYKTFLNNDNETICCMPICSYWFKKDVKNILDDPRYNVETLLDDKGENYYIVTEKERMNKTCDNCKYLYTRLQGIHETYEAALCSFNNREKWIASESDGMKFIPTPKWCPLESEEKENQFMKESIPLNTSPRTDPYE